MIEKLSGQVAYAVMSFGGFLGMGESYHPLSWKALNYDPRQGGYGEPVIGVAGINLSAALIQHPGFTPLLQAEFLSIEPKAKVLIVPAE